MPPPQPAPLPGWGPTSWEHNWEKWGGSVGSPKPLTGAEPGPPDIGAERRGHA